MSVYMMGLWKKISKITIDGRDFPIEVGFMSYIKMREKLQCMNAATVRSVTRIACARLQGQRFRQPREQACGADAVSVQHILVLQR